MSDDLAKRLTAQIEERVLWMPGMRLLRKPSRTVLTYRILWVVSGCVVWAGHDPDPHGNTNDDEVQCLGRAGVPRGVYVLDLGDPGTAGCLLDMLFKACEEDEQMVAEQLGDFSAAADGKCLAKALLTSWENNEQLAQENLLLEEREVDIRRAGVTELQLKRVRNVAWRSLRTYGWWLDELVAVLARDDGVEQWLVEHEG